MAVGNSGRDRGVIASPNIWHWPAVYEEENRAQDTRGAVYAALRESEIGRASCRERV